MTAVCKTHSQSLNWQNIVPEHVVSHDILSMFGFFCSQVAKFPHSGILQSIFIIKISFDILFYPVTCFFHPAAFDPVTLKCVTEEERSLIKDSMTALLNNEPNILTLCHFRVTHIFRFRLDVCRKQHMELVSGFSESELCP